MAASWADLGIEIPSGAAGNVKCVCPWCSGDRRHHRDKSLSVDTDRLLFRCHHCGKRGSLGGGVDTEAFGRRPEPRIYRRPDPLPEADLSPAAREWFASRGIDLAAVARRGVSGDDRAIRFPYYRDGALVNVKTRYRGKRFAMEAGCELIFWGIDGCAGAEQIVIVEGEMDALACETAGLPYVLSVPNGAQTGAMDFLASGAAIFDRCHTVILAVDGDPAGQGLEGELARRIGKEKCWRVRWPGGHKDANDVLLALGGAAVCRAVADAEPFPIEGIHETADLKEGAMALWRTGRQHGVSTGWPSLDNLYTIKPGQLTVVTGVPGSGKSEFLDALTVNLIRRHGWGFGLYSPENFPPESHALRLAAKWTGKPVWDGPTPRITEAEIGEFFDALAGHLSFLAPSAPTLDDVLTLAGALVFRHGITGLVIDPWNELDHSRPRELTETEHISRSLARIRAFARDRECHVWLMAHPRIMRRGTDGKVPIPTPYDISGSAHWYNKADNCITVWRNKEDDAAPVEIHVQKIRFRENGQLGVAYLGYDKTVGGYRELGRWESAGRASA